MLSQNPVLVVAIFLFFIFFVALVLGLYIQRRRAVISKTDEGIPRAATTESSPINTEDERLAAPISEVIEDMVRERMAADPALDAFKLDFGTSADGSLEIWIDDERYGDVDAIRDERIKTIIKDAVLAYNEGTS
jgi:hypothetical protein